MRHASRTLQACLLGLTFGSPPLAQAATTLDASADASAVQTLDSISVTTARSAKSIADIAGAVYSIDREQIATQNAAGRSTADILGMLIPSLAPPTGTTSNYGMTMHGRSVQVMIDGVPLTGARDGARQLNSISPALIERVEVLSGATSLFGAGATGGIINIITQEPDDKPLAFRTEVGMRSPGRVGSNAMAWNIAQLASFNHDQFSGSLGVSYSRQGELRDAHGNRIGPEIAQTDRQDTRTVDINGRLIWRPDANQEISLGARHYNDRQNSDYGPDYGPGLAALFSTAYEPSRAAIEGLSLDEQPRTRHQSLNLQYRNKDILGGQALTLETYYRNEKGRWFPSVAAIVHPSLPGGYTYGAMQSNTDIDVWGIRSALSKRWNIAGRSLQLTYGLDFEQEKDSQHAQTYDIAAFMASNGLRYQSAARYAMGPDVRVRNTGLFAQTDYALTDRLSVQFGIRHQRIRNQVSDSVPYAEAITAAQVPGYAARTLQGGSISHSRTLFNVGAVYRLQDHQQLFASFSQGFSLPDTQRMLRDVSVAFAVNNASIEPIKVNSYELGWRLTQGAGLNASITAFYNTSDKVVQFNRDYSVSVANTDERVWGLEANMDYPLSRHWTVGGSVSLTRGQYRDAAGAWRELNAYRISPLKTTLYAAWQPASGYSVRLQALVIGGTDRAYDDAQSAAVNANIRDTPAARIAGYTVLDLIAQAPLLGGNVSVGIYNLADRDYRTVYSQQAAATYGKLSSLPAPGRTFALGYSIAY